MLLPGVLDTQLSSIVLAAVQGVDGVLGIIPDIRKGSLDVFISFDSYLL